MITQEELDVVAKRAAFLRTYRALCPTYTNRVLDLLKDWCYYAPSSPTELALKNVLSACARLWPDPKMLQQAFKDALMDTRSVSQRLAVLLARRSPTGLGRRAKISCCHG
jgi:hypothetical protein